MERQIATKPLSLPRSTRVDEWRGLTSCRAGEIVPIAYFPLLREDALRGQVMVQVRMEEALHTIINPIRVTMQAHLISKVALARFDGSMEVLNRSYMGQTLPGGGAAPAWHVEDVSIATMGDDDKGHAIYDKLGIHYRQQDYMSGYKLNSDLLESYWTVVNWRSRAISKALPQWTVTTADKLAPAFWNSWKFDHIKPTFDAAMMEGEVPVELNASRLPLQNFGWADADGTGTNNARFVDGNGSVNLASLTNMKPMQIDSAAASDGNRRPYANLSATSGAISLANIEMAKKSQAFAKMRERYQGVPDEYLIDLLMQGIEVPPEDFREPILIGRASSVIGQIERYATDGASLDQSVTNGMTQLRMTLNTPAVNPGGIVLVTLEIVPEQLYERVTDIAMQMDATGSAEWLPNAMEDFLDPQKVETVQNRYADTFHGDATGIFGYAPLNHGWQRSLARVGGRYKRPLPDAFVEDRQRIWSVEKADPTLSEDFYLCPSPFPHTVFADAEADPFEVITVATTSIRGLTVFGQGFEEDDDHYDKIIAQVDTGRIESVAPSVMAEGETETPAAAPAAETEGAAE